MNLKTLLSGVVLALCLATSANAASLISSVMSKLPGILGNERPLVGSHLRWYRYDWNYAGQLGNWYGSMPAGTVSKTPNRNPNDVMNAQIWRQQWSASANRLFSYFF